MSHAFVYKDVRAALAHADLWSISGSEGSRGGCGDPIAISRKFDAMWYMRFLYCGYVYSMTL